MMSEVDQALIYMLEFYLLLIGARHKNIKRVYEFSFEIIWS